MANMIKMVRGDSIILVDLDEVQECELDVEDQGSWIFGYKNGRYSTFDAESITSYFLLQKMQDGK